MCAFSYKKASGSSANSEALFIQNFLINKNLA
jgi:hypothetical protein